MSSPFPGMDPYLEDREIWPGFHHVLADEIMAQLNAKLSDRYYADVEVRTVLEEINIATTYDIYSDVSVLQEAQPLATPIATVTTPAAPVQRVAVPSGQTKLRSVNVYVSETKELVTVIELLSPFNKRGQGLDQYRQKRERILYTTVHLVEIDLLRAGQRPGWELYEPPLDTDYICLVNRARPGYDRVSEIWPVSLSEPLPLLPIPLVPPDSDIVLDPNDVLRNIYQRAAYARRIDYSRPVPPPDLRPQMLTWLQEANIGG